MKMTRRGLFSGILATAAFLVTRSCRDTERLHSYVETDPLNVNGTQIQNLPREGFDSEIDIVARCNANQYADVHVRADHGDGTYADVHAENDSDGVSRVRIDIDGEDVLKAEATGVEVETISTDGSNRWELGGAENKTPTGVARWVEITIDGTRWNLYAEAD